ncbi:hypothetical protein XA68_14013 [Ophiocordyceps unilateralis]|uniref:Uncharacterized protein n=1 Tax=Ophiocordyceps unilateralis TaxID=268505 RepID=A0A2A9PAH8_OPHUN|nr:hypothetical protein XA68_14013 [Ophiocordyceps unilateralis]
MHPAAFTYLRHGPGGFGCLPSAGRRWRQITRLRVSVQTWDFQASRRDQLRTLDDYLRAFAPRLKTFSFTWVGRLRGPCPLGLAEDGPLPPRKLFHELTSAMSPLPTRPGREAIHFPLLRRLRIRNATMSAAQLTCLIAAHRDTVTAFDFHHVLLLDGGWHEALSWVVSDSAWVSSGLVSAVKPGAQDAEEEEEEEEEEEVSSLSNSLVSADDFLPSPSAAVEAVTKALFGSREQLDEWPSERPSNPADDARTISTSIRKKKRVRRRRRHRHQQDDRDIKSDDIGVVTISAPLVAAPAPQLTLLQPTVYDGGEEGVDMKKKTKKNDDDDDDDDDDASHRRHALQRAKEAVLSRLGRGKHPCRPRAAPPVDDRRSLESRSAVVPLFFKPS